MIRRLSALGGRAMAIAMRRPPRRSVVVIDPNGDTFRKAVAARRHRRGRTVVRLDPMSLCGPGGDGFNPLSLINPEALDFLDQCRDLAGRLVVRQGTETEPYWNAAAEGVLCAMTAFVRACEADPDQRNLTTVRMLTTNRKRFALAVEAMGRSHHEGVRRCGEPLGWLEDRELASVLASVQRHTAWMDSPALAACMARSTFDPRDLRRGNLSLYLVIPAHRLVTWAPLVRMWIGSFVMFLEETRHDPWIIGPGLPGDAGGGPRRGGR